MKFQESVDGWLIQTERDLVELIQIDFRVGLFLSGSGGATRIHIESRFHLRDADGIDHLLVPEKTSTIGPALSLFNTELVEARIEKARGLSLGFSNGYSLLVPPDEKFEAWQISSGKFLMVCSPGGEIAFFSDENSK